MVIAAHFLFALAAILSAHLAFSKPTKACSAPPQYFTVNGFTTFTPSSTNTQSGIISFLVEDTSCFSSTILNPQTPRACNDTSFDYLWDGALLTVMEMYTPCANVSTRVQTSGQISNISLYCYPVEPPYPLGYGTLCQTPTGQVTGDFMRNITLF